MYLSPTFSTSRLVPQCQQKPETNKNNLKLLTKIVERRVILRRASSLMQTATKLTQWLKVAMMLRKHILRSRKERDLKHLCQRHLQLLHLLRPTSPQARDGCHLSS